MRQSTAFDFLMRTGYYEWKITTPGLIQIPSLTKKSVQKRYKVYTKIIQATKFVYILYAKIV